MRDLNNPLRTIMSYWRIPECAGTYHVNVTVHTYAHTCACTSVFANVLFLHITYKAHIHNLVHEPHLCTCQHFTYKCTCVHVSFMLSYAVPVIRSRHLPCFSLYVDLYKRFELSQLSCLGSSVGRVSAYIILYRTLKVVGSSPTRDSNFSFERLLSWDLICRSLCCLSQVSGYLSCMNKHPVDA